MRKSGKDLCALRTNRVGGMGTLMRKNAGKLGETRRYMAQHGVDAPTAIEAVLGLKVWDAE